MLVSVGRVALSAMSTSGVGLLENSTLAEGVKSCSQAEFRQSRNLWRSFGSGKGQASNVPKIR